MTRQSEVHPLRRVALRHPGRAFGSQERIDAQWRSLGYLGAPDFGEACREADGFAALLESLGASIEWLDAPEDEDGGEVVSGGAAEGVDGVGATLGLDSLYVRDASIPTSAGAVLCRMGKGARRAEPAAHGTFFEGHDGGVLGRIEAPGTLEGGDVTWLDERTLAVGRGYRTNDDGIAQLRAFLPDVEVVAVPLPHWRGPGDVFHLMSILSPLAEDLLLVHSPLMPVPLRERLIAGGFGLVEVPTEEMDTQGANVLAVAPRVAVALEGNPETRRRMEAAGVEVHTYVGREISVKGCGGPTCLTRPIERS